MGSAGGNPPAGEPGESQRKAVADHPGWATGTRSQTGRSQSSSVETANRAALQPAPLYAAGRRGIHSIAPGNSRNARPDGILRGTDGGDSSARPGDSAS